MLSVVCLSMCKYILLKTSKVFFFLNISDQYIFSCLTETAVLVRPTSPSVYITFPSANLRTSGRVYCKINLVIRLNKSGLLSIIQIFQSFAFVSYLGLASFVLFFIDMNKSLQWTSISSRGWSSSCAIILQVTPC